MTSRKRCANDPDSVRERAKRRKADAERARRATTDDSSRVQRLLCRRQQQQNQQTKAIQGGGDHVTQVALSSCVRPLPPETLSRLFIECGKRVSVGAMEENVCCVCDCYHPVSEMMEKDIDRNPMFLRSMRMRLKPPANLPPKLLQYYNAASASVKLHGILLSSAGVSQNGSEVILRFCKACGSSLANNKLSSPPKFAIANSLYIGELPSCFNDTTVTENAMLKLAQPTQFVSVVRGGRHSSIRSHAYYFRATPAPPAQLLPEPVVTKGIIGVSMVGAMTPRQKAETAKRYNVRVPRIREQYGWYRVNNKLYESVELDANLENFHDSNVVSDHTGDDEDSPSVGQVANELDESNWRFNAPTPAYSSVSSDDETYEQTAVALVTNYSVDDANSQARRVLNNGTDVAVWRSSEILSDFAKPYWTHAFCELFPFGRGGLDEPHPVLIGIVEYLRYCLRLSHRRHASHPSFLLVSFDVLARHEAMRAVYLRAKLAPHVLSSAPNVDRVELLSHVEYQEKRLSAINRRQRLPDPPPQSQAVRDLFSGISTGLRAHWGTNEERADARTKVMSMQLKLGQPSIFFTFPQVVRARIKLRASLEIFQTKNLGELDLRSTNV